MAAEATVPVAPKVELDQDGQPIKRCLADYFAKALSICHQPPGSFSNSSHELAAPEPTTDCFGFNTAVF